jgi:hypothetical protein
MNTVHAEASAMIEASALNIYRILSDYRHAHPAILPKPYFERLEVEVGGQGAGTVFWLWMNVLGQHRVFHETVTEPVPGRVLVETDFDTGQSSTFTLEPLDENGPTRVTIATDFEPRAGPVGTLERITNPPISRHIFRKELALLAEYVEAQKVWDREAQAQTVR